MPKPREERAKIAVDTTKQRADARRRSHRSKADSNHSSPFIRELAKLTAKYLVENERQTNRDEASEPVSKLQ